MPVCQETRTFPEPINFDQNQTIHGTSQTNTRCETRNISSTDKMMLTSKRKFFSKRTSKNQQSQVVKEEVVKEDDPLYVTVTGCSEREQKPHEINQNPTEQPNLQNFDIDHGEISKIFTKLSLDLKSSKEKSFVLSEDGRMIAVYVNSKGATIAFGKICLNIPEGALKQEEILFIYNLGYRNTPGQISLCPEVYCGPPGLKFEMYVTLSIDLFGNIPTTNTTQKLHVYCKEKEKDWMKIGDVGGTSFIKNNRSYTLVNHFTIFKVVLDQTNDDCTEYQQCQLVEVHPRVNSVYLREVIEVDFRKVVMNADPISDSTSVGYIYIYPGTQMRIVINDLQVPIHGFSKNLLNENCPTISHSFLPGTSRMPSNIKCLVDNYHLELSLCDSGISRTKKEPQTNVNKENIQILCKIIEKEKTDDFENWLCKVDGGEEKDIERAVTKYLAMNDNDFRKLCPPFRRYGMNAAADKILKLPNYNHSRRSLPPVSGPGPLETSFCGIPPNRIQVYLHKESGPKAMTYFKEEDEEEKEENAVGGVGLHKVEEDEAMGREHEEKEEENTFEEEEEAMDGEQNVDEEEAMYVEQKKKSMGREHNVQEEEMNGRKQEVKEEKTQGIEDEQAMGGVKEVTEKTMMSEKNEIKKKETVRRELDVKQKEDNEEVEEEPLYANLKCDEIPKESAENNYVSYNKR